MLHIQWLSDSTLTEATLLLIAFVLSAVIGVERHRQLKSAGLRTHTLVGLGSAVFTLVSSYGFAAVEATEAATFDPSRIAAQIVSGIGFLGAGVIFVRQNAVNGLTTAASIWVTAAIGMACGAGMPVLAAAATLLHLAAVGILSIVGRRIPVAESKRCVVVRYKEGRGALRSVLEASTTLGFEAMLTSIRRLEHPGSRPRVQAVMTFRRGNGSLDDLVERLSALPDILSVVVTRLGEDQDDEQ